MIPSSSLRISVLTALLTIVSVLSLQWLDVYHHYFALADMAYVQQTVLQVVLALVVSFLVVGVGERLLAWSRLTRGWQGVDGAESLLLAAMLGIWAVGLLAFLLAAVNLLSPEWTLSLTVVLLLLSRPQRFFPWLTEVWQHCRSLALAKSNHWLGWVELLLAGGLLGWLSLRFVHMVLVCGLVPQLPGNDEVGNYLPYYADVLSQHGFWPSKWFIHYSFTKGAGFQYYMATLAGLFTVQLANVMLYVFSSLLMLFLLRRVGVAMVVALALVVVYSFSPVVSQFFVKNHGAVAAYASMILYLLARMFNSPNHSWPTLAILAMAVVATIIFNPTMFFIVGGLAGGGLVSGWVGRRPHQVNLAWWGMAMAMITIVGLSSLNYLQSGMGDFLFHRLETLLGGIPATPAWDPIAVKTQHLVTSTDGHIDLSRGYSLGWVLGSIHRMIPNSMIKYTGLWGQPLVLTLLNPLVLISLSLGAVAYVIQKKRSDDGFCQTTLYLSGLVVLLALGILTVFTHLASQRGTIFRLFPLWLCLGAGAQWWLSLLPAAIYRQVGAILLALLCLGIWDNLLVQHLPNRVGITARQLLSGRSNYLEAVSKRWPMLEEWQASKMVPPDSRIVHLNFQPGAYLLPGVEYGRPIQNSYNERFSQVMFADEERALAVLRQKGFDYLFVRLEEPLVLSARAAIFTAAGLQHHYRMLWQGEQGVLLTNRLQEGRPLSAEFLARYGQRQQDPDSYVAGHWRLFEKGLAEFHKLRGPGGAGLG